MLKWFQAVMPKEDAFFGLFADHAAILVQGADAMVALFQPGADIAQCCARITEFEHKADDITRETMHLVRRTFITPFDRSAITGLISSMDDAIDEMRQTAKAVMRFEVTAFEPQMLEISKLAASASRLVVEAVPLLRKIGKNGGPLHDITERIVHLEGEADDLHEEGLRALYHAHGKADPMAFFVGREIYSHLERVLDRYEDVANEIQGIVIDHA